MLHGDDSERATEEARQAQRALEAYLQEQASTARALLKTYRLEP
jgi:hypothetical protein